MSKVVRISPPPDWPKDCPPFPNDEDLSEFGYERQAMTRWFDPRELVRDGIRAVLAALFGAYADKREIEALAAASAAAHKVPEGTGDLWIDFVADVGDGWDATFTIAWLLSQPNLELRGHGETTPHVTVRGRILIFGGDQVYPLAGPKQYENHLEAPYRAALPWLPKDQTLEVYAIPGNHDWYDGLTAFVRFFGQDRWLGARRMRQERSYFALRLPHDWWIWGIDTQLAADIDRPQLEYFRKLAEPYQDEQQRLILCVPEPAWIKEVWGAEGASRNLEQFVDRCVPRKWRPVDIYLTGDLHHYCRYGSNSGRQLITCGGGGAFLYGTHQLPSQVLSPEQEIFDVKSGGAYPSPNTSRLRTLGVIKLPFRNPWFAALVGGVQLLIVWAVFSGANAGDAYSRVQKNGVSLVGLRAMWGALLQQTGTSAFAAALILGFWAALAAFCHPPDTWSKVGRVLCKWIVGAAHAALQLSLSLICLHFLIRWLEVPPSVKDLATFGRDLLEWGAFLLVGGLLTSIAFALYLLLTNLFGFHRNEIWASQSRTDYKSFLRLRFGIDGRLTIYPVGVRHSIPRAGWRLRRRGQPGQPWFEPKAGTVACHLIERPLVIPGCDKQRE